MRSNRQAGQSRGMTRCSMRTGPPATRSGWPPLPRPAASAASQASSRSQRAASSCVSTPIEHPGSKASAYRSQGSSARLIAYLRASYHRVARPHGSGEDA